MSTPAAVIETRVVHDLHRRATTLLADALDRPSSPVTDLVALRDFVVAALDHHHRSEDTSLWPLIVAGAPELAGPLGILSAEHESLDAHLDALYAAPIDDGARVLAAERAAAVRDLVHDHLAHEEPVLFPALRDHISADAWYRFSAATVASAPAEGTDLLVALLHEVGTDDELEVIFQHLPDPARQALPAKRAQGTAVLARLTSERVEPAVRRVR